MHRISIRPLSEDGTGQLETLAALLSDVFPDGLEIQDDAVLAYCDDSLIRDEQVLAALESWKALFNFSMQVESLPDINWNREWESRFEPVVVEDILTIRAEFHDIRPTTEFTITIQPRMSFGTGHHATTWMMVRMMRMMRLDGKKVLDAGTGTGILAILAAMWGAECVTGFDIDEWSYRNALDNLELNREKIGGAHIEFHNGSLLDVADGDFEVILANINRNYLVDEAERLASKLNNGTGCLILSGFYHADSRQLLDIYCRSGFVAQYLLTRDDWACLLLRKQFSAAEFE